MALLDFHHASSALVSVIKENLKTVGNVASKSASSVNTASLHSTDFHNCFGLDFNPRTHPQNSYLVTDTAKKK